MATVPTVSNQWIPEDDILLKNAVEAGASLEALAKGAIQFSRRYTLRELQERWHSLLYDPDISAQASARVFELEISGFHPALKLNKSDREISKKRKYESIRKKYYAMRKKLRDEYFSNNDLSFFESNPHEFSAHDADFQNQSVHDDNSRLGENHLSIPLGLEEEDLDILRHAFPGTIRDACGAANKIIGGLEFDENMTSSVREGGNHILEADIKNRNGQLTLGKSSVAGNSRSSGDFSSFQTSVHACDRPHLRHVRSMHDVPAHVAEDIILNDVAGKENSSSIYTGEFSDPDSLLNLSNENEILSMDVDEKRAENKGCVDITESVIEETNKDGQENGITKVDPNTVALSEGCSVLKDDMPSMSDLYSDLTELCHGKICCTLNTEDTEIPCNDDIFLLIHPSMVSFGSSPPQPNTSVSISACAPDYEKDNVQDLNLVTKGKDSTKNCYGSRDSSSVHPLGGAAKSDNPGFVNKTIGNFSKGRSLCAIPKACSRGLAKKEVAGVDMKVGDSSATMMRSREAGSASTPLPESFVPDTVSGHEECPIDDDVPYFSDVEAMILEMDLDPDDQDTHIIRQVPSYQYDDTKRTIIMLEQGARSCLRRSMTSQGALAILYGRHLRHYIKKPEVLLGRSTDDLDVDIDLRKEGRANKISRRQAIIKMEADGSFFFKNLGKSSVSVNGMTVATGHMLNLSSSCLIEIKGMSFVFEINQRYVREHLGRFCLKNKGKTGKYDWSVG